MAKTKEPRPEATDAEVKADLIQAMAEVGVDPALIYAFEKTGLLPMGNNHRRWPLEKRHAWNDAIDEYHAINEYQHTPTIQ